MFILIPINDVKTKFFIKCKKCGKFYLFSKFNDGCICEKCITSSIIEQLQEQIETLSTPEYQNLELMRKRREEITDTIDNLMNI